MAHPWTATVAMRERDRVTMFELFFDLVFVFALTRVVAFMEHALGARSVVEGLLLLVLLWWAWSAFIWLGNQVRLDHGYVQVGILVAMGGLFVAALVIPQAWTRGTAVVGPPVVLALAFTVVRISYVCLFVAVSRGDRQLRTQVTLDAVLQGASSVLLLVGAGVGGTFQTVFWSAAFAVDFGGGRIVSTYSGWRLTSPRHFVERHGLVLIIAIGETLVSAGSVVGLAVSRAPVLLAAVLGLTVAVSLWWLYFHHLAGAAEQALTDAPPARRAALARDAYTLAHFPLVAGVVYVALGLELVLREVVADNTRADLVTATLVLCGGISLYLAGLGTFRRILLGTWRRSP